MTVAAKRDLNEAPSCRCKIINTLGVQLYELVGLTPSL